MGGYRSGHRNVADTGRILAQDPAKTQALEDFWLAHKLSNEEGSQQGAVESPSDRQAKRRQNQASPNGKTHTRQRAVSTASALAPPDQSLSPHHPALSLPILLDTFGPLIFPVYKAALLRKRILMIGQAPVELACNFGKLITSSFICVDLFRYLSVRYLCPFGTSGWNFRLRPT